MHEDRVSSFLRIVRSRGHQPSDIKKLLISHAHIDHMGGAKALEGANNGSDPLRRHSGIFVFLNERKDLIGNEGGKFTCATSSPTRFYSDDTPFRLGSVSVSDSIDAGHKPAAHRFSSISASWTAKSDDAACTAALAQHDVEGYFRQSGLRSR